MALLLPQLGTAPLESLHQLASIRQRLSVQQQHRSRRSARANHGAAEISTKTHAASSDHIKIPSTEPCCKISPLVVAPKKPVRRSYRLRARKGRDGAKTEPTEEMEAAEWVSRVLANNGMVEVDPVTMAELSAEKTDTTNTHNRIASLTTSSEVPDYFLNRGPAFPKFPRVPFEVAIAAGSAVALATVAAILNSLSNQRVGANSSQSDPEGSNLGSGFAGEPVKSSSGSNPPQLRRDKKLPADVLANTAGVSAGSAILTAFDQQPGSVRTGRDYSSMPLPPSLSKNGSKSESAPRERQRKWDSVTPFFTPHRPTESFPRPSPSNSRWSEEKYNSVPAFFPSDRLAGDGSSLKSVTPFFADEQQGGESKNGTSVESVTPFFVDDQGRELKNGPSLGAVTPFFADEQGSKRKNGLSLEGVTPFFADEQGRSSTGESQSKGSYQNVTPFFPDDRVARSDSTEQPSRSRFKEQSGVWNGESNEAMRDSLAEAMSPNSVRNLPRMVNLKGRTPVNSSQFTDQRSVGDERVFAAVPEDLLSGPMQPEGKQLLADMANRSQYQHREFINGTTEGRLASEMSNAFSFGGAEAPSVARDLSPEEFASLEEIKEEEERRHAKFQALQAAFPALAIGAGAVGALVGVDGAFEMVGLTATASFISYELLWANKRKELLDEVSRITDHHKLFRFLQKRKIVKDDC